LRFKCRAKTETEMTLDDMNTTDKNSFCTHTHTHTHTNTQLVFHTSAVNEISDQSSFRENRKKIPTNIYIYIFFVYGSI